jgi:type I restriction enzyme R subunit
VIQKIHNLEPITNDDLNELERILWHELGTKDDYTETTDIGNLAAFVRSLIGLSQEAVNEKFGEYLSGNLLNSQQQEFVHTIINYVRENGDVELADMVNTEPFNNYDLNEMFGVNLQAIVRIVGVLHNSVVAAAA